MPAPGPAVKRECAHVRVQHRHGTYNCYVNDKCRCAPCRKSNSAHTAARRKAHYLRRLRPANVDATESRRYLDALRLKGWSLQMLTQQLGGIDRRHLRTVYTRPRLSREKADRIRAVHDRLELVSPPTSTRTERIAVGMARTLNGRRGAVPALAWQNIADPDEATPPTYLPAPGNRRTRVEMLAEIEHFRGFGDTDEQIAARLNIEVGSMLRAITRAETESQVAA